MFSSFFNDQQQQKLPDLPSPTNQSEFEQLANKLFQDVLFLEKESSDWQLVVEKEDVGVWELPTRQKGAAVCVKSKGIMPRSAKVINFSIFNFIFSRFFFFFWNFLFLFYVFILFFLFYLIVCLE